MPSAARAAHQQLTDEEVVARVLDGDAPLFEILMRRHNQRVFRVVRAITRDDTEAEDVAQQAYLAAYLNLSQFARSASFVTWLTRIAINAALARIHKTKRRAEVELVDDIDPRALPSTAPSPEDAAAGQETRALLESAIDRLPEGYRLVFVLREVQQLNLAETAACLEISEDNVKVRLHRAKAMLRDALYARMEASAAGAFPFLGARCDRIVEAVLRQIAAHRR